MGELTENFRERLASLLEAAFSKCEQSDQLETLTDLYFKVDISSQELQVYADEELLLSSVRFSEITTTANPEEVLRDQLRELAEDYELLERFEKFNLLKPFSLLIVDAQFDQVDEVYLLESGDVIIKESLFVNIDKELDDFLDKLMKN